MEAETGTSEDSEEKSSEEGKTGTIIREAMEELLEFQEKLDKGRKDILNTILDGISGLEGTYDKRLTKLEEDIKGLKGGNGKEKGAAFDFIPFKEEHLFSIDINAQLEDDLNNEILSGKLKDEFKTKKGITLSENVTIIKEKEDRWTLTNEEKIYCIKKQDGKFLVYDKSKGVAETLGSVQKEHLEKIVKTLLGESGMEDLKDMIEKLRGSGLLGITDDKLKGITTFLDSLKQVPKKDIKTIEESKKLKEELRKIGESGLTGITTPPEELERFRQIMSLYTAVSKRDNKIPELDGNRLLLEFLDSVEERMNKMNIHLFYNEGVILLRKGAFGNAYKYFKEITKINENLKGAWLNRGVAAGESGDIEEEMFSYKKALEIDKKYEKALHNMKIAERKNRKLQR
jgi:tetratricopeptide (TPR) repeat protein